MSRATPRLRMFAGPNGSGKSTIKAVVEAEIGSDLFGVYINADNIEFSIRQTGYLNVAAYGVATNSEDVLGFFRTSSFLAEKELTADAARLEFANGQLSFRSVEVSVETKSSTAISGRWNCLPRPSSMPIEPTSSTIPPQRKSG